MSTRDAPWAPPPLAPWERGSRAVSSASLEFLLPDPPAPAEPLPSYHVQRIPAPVPLEESKPAARPAPLPYDDLQSSDALVDYWDGLRGSRALPSVVALDRTRIAISWPDTLMVSYGGGDPAMPQMTRLSRLTNEVEYGQLGHRMDPCLRAAGCPARYPGGEEAEFLNPARHPNVSSRPLTLRRRRGRNRAHPLQSELRPIGRARGG